MRVLLFLTGLLIAAQVALAEDNVTVQMLSQSSVSWDGGNIQYPEGDAEIALVKIDVPDDGAMPMHCHFMPVAAYVARGAIQVTTSTGEKKVFKGGEAFIEVMNRWHEALGVGTDTQLIVFYAGKKSMPLSIEKSSDPALASKCN